ncbi:sugar ABC transporter permease, partial [Bifidobacterium pseudocatenulatum]|nr:sugar ABC transporter permease [Bifidobacterium pseudocatenulatum]
MDDKAAKRESDYGNKCSSVRVNRHRADWRGWKFMWPFALVFTF